MKIFKRTMTAIWWVFRINPAASLLYVFYRVLSGIVPAVRILVLAQVINAMLAGTTLRDIALEAAVLAITLIWDVVVPPTASFIEQIIQKDTAVVLHKHILSKQAALKYACLEDKTIREKIERVQEQAGDVLWRAWYDTLNMLESVVAIVSQLIIFCAIRWWLGPAFLLISVPVLLLAAAVGQKEYKANQQVTQHKRTYRMLHDVLTSRETALERSMFAYSTALDQKYCEEYEKARKYQHGIRKKMFVRLKTTSVVCALLSFVLIVLLLNGLEDGVLTTGMFISLACAALNMVSLLLSVITDQIKDIYGLNELLVEAEEYFSLPEQDGVFDLPRFEELHTVEFRHVSFAYPGTEKTVLNDISLKMEKGRRYALVGINGAGKSTLLKLLMRQYDDYSGEIRVNGKDIRTIPYAVIKGFFGFVSQDSYHFAMTVRENLCMGQSFADERLMDVLERVGLAEKVRGMPRLLDTPLGKLTDGNADLSIGEWQRLSIARVLLRPFGMLLLDEPSSALDPMAERGLLDSIASCTMDRNVLLISHRLSVAKDVDHIYVINGGELSESGSFEELMAANGLFRYMFDEQKGWYAE